MCKEDISVSTHRQDFTFKKCKEIFKRESLVVIKTFNLCLPLLIKLTDRF